MYWPMSVLRLRAEDPDRLIELGDRVLKAWRGYTDEAAFIYAETDGEPHNTITLIARKNGDRFELDLVLRNNITTEEFSYWALSTILRSCIISRRENIGLIEVMGLAVLPSRLKTELQLLADYIVEGKISVPRSPIAKHVDPGGSGNFFQGYTQVDRDNVDGDPSKECRTGL